MLKDLLRRSGAVPIVAAAFAAIVIGCGGGGGGGGGSTSSTAGTVAGTTASTTSTAGTTATDGSSAGTDGSLGALPQNRIFYAEATLDALHYNVLFSSEDNTVTGTYASNLSFDTPSSPDPSAANQIVFAFQPTGSPKYGIYRNTSISLTGATTIVAPNYGEIDSLQVSRDGSRVVFIAAVSAGGTQGLYSVPTAAGSAPTKLDNAVDASLSSSGDRVVYSSYPLGGSLPDIYIRKFTESSPHRMTNNTLDEADPQFSKDGTKIVFAQQVGTTDRFRLAVCNVATGVVTTLDPIPTASVRGPSFNGDGTRISFVVQSSTDSVNGIYTTDTATGATATQVLASVRLQTSTYWTTINGRSPGGIPFGLNVHRKR